jgi:predicted nucleotidyltransferase
MTRFAPKPIPQNEARSIVEAKLNWILSISNPARVYVFGSAARSEMTDHSDVDLALIFLSESDLRAAREVVFKRAPGDDWAQDVLLFTQVDFDRKKKIGGVCHIIASEGVCLFKRNNE